MDHASQARRAGTRRTSSCREKLTKKAEADPVVSNGTSPHRDQPQRPPGRRRPLQRQRRRAEAQRLPRLRLLRNPRIAPTARPREPRAGTRRCRGLASGSMVSRLSPIRRTILELVPVESGTSLPGTPMTLEEWREAHPDWPTNSRSRIHLVRTPYIGGSPTTSMSTIARVDRVKPAAPKSAISELGGASELH